MNMVQKELTWLQRMMQIVPASNAGFFAFSNTLHHIDAMLWQLSNGQVSIPSLGGLSTVMLTTTGAKSGLSRTMPLVGIPDGERILLIASNWGRPKNPAWYYNLRAHPRASLTLPGGRTGIYTAHEAQADEYQRYWNQAVDLYMGYSVYKQRAGGRHIPIMVLTPVTADTQATPE